MAKRFEGDEDIEPHQTIWLQPWCKGCEQHAYGTDGRQWCENDPWSECEECGRKSVKYVLAPADNQEPAGRQLDSCGSGPA